MPRLPASIAAPLLAVSAMLAAAATGHGADCSGGNGLGVSRIVEIDTTGGPVFGTITKQTREESFLGRKEVVLTFDDGPMPGVTKPILDTLDAFCTRATFFSVGKMAIAYPDLVREIMKRGHTLGTHTWSHPMSLPRLRGNQGRDQIESGFAAVALAAGAPIAPFFRFPGLNDSRALLAHLEERGIATFTVDVVSNDSYIADPRRFIERTMARVMADGGGILLFHDIKPQTARALPTILAELKANGFAVVHMRAKAPIQPDAGYSEAVRSHVAQKSPAAMKSLLTLINAAPPPAPASAPLAALPPDAAVAVSSPADAVPPEPPTQGAAGAAVAASPLARVDWRPATPAGPEVAAASAVQSPQSPPPAVAKAPETAAEPTAPLPLAAPAESGVRPATEVPAFVTPQAEAPPPVQGASSTPAAAAPERRPQRKRQARIVHVQPQAETAGTSGGGAKAQIPAWPQAQVAPSSPSGVEVLAGSYGKAPSPSSPSVGSPAASAGGAPAVPEVIGGSYGADRPVVPLRRPRAWDESLGDRIRESGN